METQFTELQLDALREISSIGSGTAATSLSNMLARTVEVTVPAVYALPLADAVEAVGPPESDITAVLVPVSGDLTTMVLLLFGTRDAEVLCNLLGVDADSEIGLSALAEIGNILASSYLGAIVTMTGLSLEPAPPQTVMDMLGAVVGTVLALGARDTDTALLLDSELSVDDADANFAFLLLISPGTSGVGELFSRLGIAG